MNILMIVSAIVIGYLVVCGLLMFTKYDEWAPSWVIALAFPGLFVIVLVLIGIGDWWDRRRGIPIRYI